MNGVSFYGYRETAGSVAEQTSQTAKNETTGSIGYLNNEEPELKLNALDRDTISFRGNMDKKEDTSFLGFLFKAAIVTAGTIGILGCAHKYNWLGRLSDGKVKDFLSKGDSVTKTCHEWCAKLKGYGVDGYNKFAGWFGKNK